MVNIPAQNKEEAIDNMKRLRSYKPFQYSGKWYMIYHQGIGYFRRTEKSILNIRLKHNIDPEEFHFILEFQS